MAPRRSAALLRALATVAPGTGLREALNRILQASKGALIIVGDGPDVLNICSGGFLLDAAFSPQRLHELAKMDGAIILAPDVSRIARANVHLVPNPNVPTSETGTRHRTAERVARSLDVPVIAVSEAMRSIAIYRGDEKYTLEDIPTLLHRANQAIQTLGRYRERFDETASELSALEVEDLVTYRDVVTTLRRAERVMRLADEVETAIIELGADGRQIELQLEELLEDIDEERRLIAVDYARDNGDAEVMLESLADLTSDDLVDSAAIATIVAPDVEGRLDQAVEPSGYRQLSKLRSVPDEVVDAVVTEFSSFQKLLRATTDDLVGVTGISESHAWAIKDGISRLAETSILDRYD